MAIALNLKEFKIPEVIPESYGNMFDFKGTYTDAAGVSHNVTVFDTQYFIDHVLLYHYNRKISLPEDNPEAVFHELFTTWLNSRKDLYFKQAYAYQLKYNPIENYSSTEQMIDDTTEHEKGASHKVDYNNTDTDTLTPFTKITDETTPYTKEETTTTPYTKVTNETTPYTKEETTTTPYTKVTNETTPYTKEETTTTGATSGVPSNSTTNSRMAFNSNSFVGTDKSETDTNSKTEFKKTGTEKQETSWTGTEKIELKKTGTEKQETSWTGTEKIELKKTGTEKTERTYSGTEEHKIDHTGYVETTTDGTDTDTRNYTLKKSGNIGVMTPAEMLQKEFDGLKQDLALRALTEFIDRYTWYSVSVE